MCVLVLACRTGTPSKVIDELYGPRQVAIPKMPALGLLLEQPIFDSYNAKVRDTSARLEPSHADYRAPIDFGVHAEAMARFKDAHIYSRMRASEDQFAVFDRWVRTIDKYAGADLAYYNAHGLVPETAVVRKGEKRSNPFREKKRFDATEFVPIGTTAPGAVAGNEVLGEDEDEEVDEEKEVEGVSKRELEEAEG